MASPVLAAALISALSADARAAGTIAGCQVVLQPDDADLAWQEAVQQLRTRLRGLLGTDVDCGAIQVRADGPRTWILFTTRDGRSAERPVRAPGELFAVVEALETTIPEPTPSEQPAPMAPMTPPVPRNGAADRPTPIAPSPGSTESSKARFLIEGSGGVRLAGSGGGTRLATPNALGSVSFGIGMSINIGHWEMGVLGQYDPAHSALTGSAPPSGFSMSTYAIGLRAGRRDRVGPVDAVVGTTLSIALTEQSNQDTNGQATGAAVQDSFSKAEPRVGIFGGVVVPRHARVRLRPEVAFDIVPTHIGQTVRIDPTAQSFPALPWWSTSASLGVEWEAP